MCRAPMKEFGKKLLQSRVTLIALILLVSAGGTFAAAKPEQFRAGLSSAVEWMKFDMLAAAAEPSSSPAESKPASSPAPSSSAPSSIPASSAPARSEPAQSSEPEAAKVSLEQAAKPLRIEVSLEDQRVRVLDAEGRIVQDYACSSGEAGSETPTGTFTVTDRGESFYNPDVGEGAYYWTRFYGTFLFHSLPFDGNQKMEPEEAAKLGTPASHGCIRLEVENAEWIYDNIPKGTKVTIQ